jgi:uncharacterized protein YhhL (DUF1145 family)
MPEPIKREQQVRKSRSFPALTHFQVNVLFILGAFMIVASIAVLIGEVFVAKGDLGWTDLAIHILLIGVGALLLVPRRVLDVLERLPKLKLFGK